MLQNFRPGSNLTFVSKLFEKIVLHQLLCLLDQNNLLHTSQSAYRPKHIAETLLWVLSDLLTASEFVCISILTLISAAFDTIDHNILLTHLENTGYL